MSVPMFFAAVWRGLWIGALLLFFVWFVAVVLPYVGDPGMSSNDRYFTTGKRDYGDFSPVDKLPYTTKQVYARVPDGEPADATE